MVARALYLGYFSHERRLPPLAHHHDQRVMGEIERDHGGGLTGDEHDPPASDGHFAVIEAARLIFYSSLSHSNVSMVTELYLFNEIVSS